MHNVDDATIGKWVGANATLFWIEAGAGIIVDARHEAEAENWIASQADGEWESWIAGGRVYLAENSEARKTVEATTESGNLTSISASSDFIRARNSHDVRGADSELFWRWRAANDEWTEKIAAPLARLYAKFKKGNGCPHSGATRRAAGAGRFFTVGSYPRRLRTPDRFYHPLSIVLVRSAKKCVKSSLDCAKTGWLSGQAQVSKDGIKVQPTCPMPTRPWRPTTIDADIASSKSRGPDPTTVVTTFSTSWEQIADELESERLLLEATGGQARIDINRKDGTWKVTAPLQNGKSK